MSDSGAQSKAESNALVVKLPDDAITYQDPRQMPLEARLHQAKEHEAKLQHIMDTVPTKIKNLQGSSAGAGSGEFHIYRKIRDTERKRVAAMEKEWEEEQQRLQTKRSRDEKQQQLDSKTEKNRQKRQKRKMKAQSKKGSKPSQEGEAPAADEDDRGGECANASAGDAPAGSDLD